MHANRLVEYNGTKIKLHKIKCLIPKGRKMARTISVMWQVLSLYITYVRRIDKHNDETFVYQASTYKASPIKHARVYKRRWSIEKLFRTTKQRQGLQECFSRKIQKQFDHPCAVLLAYSIAQLEMKKCHYKNPEASIRALKKQKHTSLIRSIAFLNQNNDEAYA